MSQGYPRLLGDIGGTNARWAWQSVAGAPLQDISVLPCNASASLLESAATYLGSRGSERPRSAAIGIATAVTGDDISMTNGAWRFSISGIKRSLELERFLVINDFTALAMSLPALQSADLRAVGGGEAVPNSPLALLGPGTGLGASGLIYSGEGKWAALSGEGGHATLAPVNDLESALLVWLRKRFGHVSAERVLSGSGMVNLYQAVCEIHGTPPKALEAADITDCANDKTDLSCVKAVELFSSFLGNFAGNLALTLGARGGVYVGGGIVPRLGSAFDAELFRRRFEDKGRFENYLRAIPTWVIVASTPALVGASRALDVLLE